MSSVRQRKIFIASKLNLLADQKAQLISAVDSYVDTVVAAGNSWSDDAVNRMEYADLCLQLEKAADFIGLKCEEVSDAIGDVNASQHYQPLVGITQASCQSSLTTFHPASPSQTSQTIQATDDSTLHNVLVRIGAMQEVINFVHRNAEELTEKQGEHDSQIKEMLSKMSNADKKQDLRLKEVKEQMMMKLNENLAEVKKEQKLRFQGLEKQLQKFSDKQKKLDDETRNCTQQIERQIADVTCEMGPVKDKINEVNFMIDSFTGECSDRIKSVERLSIEVSGKVRTNSESLETLSGKVMTNSETLMTLSEKVMTNSKTLETQSEKVTISSQTLATLSETVVCNSQTLRTLSEEFKANSETLVSLNERQEHSNSSVEGLCGTLFEIKNAFKVQVRKLDQRTDKIDTKLSEVVTKVAAMIPRLDFIETQSSGHKIGFTAYLQLDKRTDIDVPISPYQKILTNVGGHFNAATGMFTVPIDGLYVVSLYMVTFDNGMYAAGIRHRPGGSDPMGDVSVCSAKTEVKGSSVFDLCVCELKAGDVLFSCSGHYIPRNLPRFLKCSCFRLG